MKHFIIIVLLLTVTEFRQTWSNRGYTTLYMTITNTGTTSDIIQDDQIVCVRFGNERRCKELGEGFGRLDPGESQDIRWEWGITRYPVDSVYLK